MKNFNKIFFLGLALTLAWGCKKVEDIVVLNPNAKLVATVSANNVVLLKDNANLDAVTVSWTTPDFGFQAAPSYSVLVDKKGGDFSKAAVISVGSELKKVFKASELNGILIGMGVVPGAVGDLDIKVQSLVGSSTVLTSTINALKATTYSEKLDLTTPWGIVGDATVNGWNGPDLPIYKSDVANVLVAYVSLNDGQIKFRQNNDWAINLGSSGSVEPDPAPSGSLAANGKNLGVKKGTYKITFNPTALTYKVEAYSWGVVGDATTNGWNGPDMPLMYDATVDLWRGVLTFNDGQIKFRQNNDWAVNYGSTGSVEPDPIVATGGLSAGGKNFGVKKGTYLVTLDLKKLKYTFKAYVPLGIVGDATVNGWNGPDQKFTYDLSTDKWVLKDVVLKAGQVKFRLNDDWAVNYGSTGSTEPDPIAASGSLSAGGKNFGVTAGTWTFEVDLRDAGKPVYKANKK